MTQRLTDPEATVLRAFARADGALAPDALPARTDLADPAGVAAGLRERGLLDPVDDSGRLILSAEGLRAAVTA
ncbi:hypothetical protein [Halosegnis marinus]|uniref:Uncharacterized protein n=2 Tax=Halosegnis marinus TaxID=3034023 RepID=A0ABD5ZNN0_9EURY|nr:hypothetical protein [Halosegnis sp. DT85]